MNKCQDCGEKTNGKYCRTCYLHNHNPLHKYRFKKGNKSWNIGLTKKTDERLAKLSITNKIIMKDVKYGKGKYNSSIECAKYENPEGYKRCQEIARKNGLGNKGNISPLRGKTKETHPSIKRASEKMKGNKNPAKRIEVRRLLKKNHWMKNPKYQKLKKGWKINLIKNNFWKNPNYKDLQQKTIQKILQNNLKLPNKLEKKFMKVLQENNLDFSYVGNGSYLVGFKNPDFINIKNKKIIEIFGRYWHKKEDEKKRINHFKKYGFDTLVLWEEEIEDVNKIVGWLNSQTLM